MAKRKTYNPTIAVPTKDLRAALRITTRALPPRAASIADRVLLQVHDQVHDGELRLTTTDMEIALTATVGLIGDGAEIEAVLRHKSLLDLVETVEDDSVSVAYDATVHTAIIKHGAKAKSQMKAPIEPGDFSPIPAVVGQVAHVSATALRTAAARTWVTAVKDDSRPALHCVLFEFRSGKLRLVSCDEFRMTMQDIDLIGESPQEADILVGQRAVRELAAILANRDEEVVITFNNNAVHFDLSGLEMTAVLTNQKYPNYQRIIPKDAKGGISVIVGDLRTAMRLAEVFAVENNNISVFTPLPDEKAIRVVAQSAETGDGSEVIDATIVGNPKQFVLSAKYVLDLLKVLPLDQRLCIVPNGTMVTFSLEGDDTLKAVMAQMHIGGSE